MKRYIRASSASAQRFGDLHDSGNYEKYRAVYDEIYEILEQYGTENDNVDIVFDRASKEDQRRLMQLAEKANGSDDPVASPEDIRRKYAALVNKYDRDRCTEYERGYFEALAECADAFGLDLE